MSSLILIELNEVPNEILDRHAARSHFMRQFLDGSDRYTTVAADCVQLDPWIAWPSFHRGVRDETHRILHLGQSVEDTDYPPLWRLLVDAGLDVGVYGSLHSNAEPDLGAYRFFVPDVFSPHDRVKPADIEAFQRFNLQMTRASGRNASSGVAAGAGNALLTLARHRRLGARTIARIGRQLASERIRPHRVSRRRNTQVELHADVFVSLFRQMSPNFATFYTNNVAAAMHRFWSADQVASSNRYSLSEEWVTKYSTEISEAIHSVELLVRRLLKVAPDSTIVLASAIGQEEIPAENHSRFLTITNVKAFLDAALRQAERGLRINPTMVPDFAIAFDSISDAANLVERLSRASIGGTAAVETPARMHSRSREVSAGGRSYLQHAYSGSNFKHPFTFTRSDDRTVHLSLQIDDYSGPEEIMIGDERLPFSDTGIGYVNHDEGVNCTAQHSAFGSLTVSSARSRRERAGAPPKEVSALDFLPSVLRHFRVEPPRHLEGGPTIDLG